MWIVTQNGRLLNTALICWFRIRPTDPDDSAWDVVAEMQVAGPCETRVASFASKTQAHLYMKELADWLGVKTPSHFVPNTQEKDHAATH